MNKGLQTYGASAGGPLAPMTWRNGYEAPQPNRIWDEMELGTPLYRQG